MEGEVIMDLQGFVKHIADQFDETDAIEFKSELEFKKLDDWSSMIALSIIAMVDEEYGITIKGDDIRKSETIKDLFDIINEYKS